MSLVLADALSPALLATLTLGLSGLLCVTALLGDLAPLLASDPAGDWIAAQPVAPRDLQRARTLVLVLVLGSLGAGGLLPAALFAPEAWSLGARCGLVALGAAQALALAAALTLLLRLAGRHATEVAVALQTSTLLLLFAGVIGALAALPLLRELEQVPAPWSWLPSAALGALAAPGASEAWAGVAWVALALALPLLPSGEEPPARGTNTPLSRLLSPLARLVESGLLAPSQRAPFRFVQAALGRARLRRARLAPGLRAPRPPGRGGGSCDRPWARPVRPRLLRAGGLPARVHDLVPTTATPEARWLLDAAPLAARDEAVGARWAVFVRVVVPLQAAISGLLLAAVPAAEVAAWSLVSLALSGLVLALAWAGSVEGAPLSRPATELGGVRGRGWSLLLNALLAGGVALATWRAAPGPLLAGGIAAATLTLLVAAGRRAQA